MLVKISCWITENSVKGSLINVFKHHVLVEIVFMARNTFQVSFFYFYFSDFFLYPGHSTLQSSPDWGQVNVLKLQHPSPGF